MPTECIVFAVNANAAITGLTLFAVAGGLPLLFLEGTHMWYVSNVMVLIPPYATLALATAGTDRLASLPYVGPFVVRVLCGVLTCTGQ